MKAKEYAEKWTNGLKEGKDPLDLLGSIGVAFMDEMHELMVSRGVKTNAGAISLANEMIQKWAALSRIVPEIRKDGFFFLLEHYTTPQDFRILLAAGLDTSVLDKEHRYAKSVNQVRSRLGTTADIAALPCDQRLFSVW